MKFRVIEFGEEEKVILYKTPIGKTMGELFKDHLDGIEAVEINNKFIDSWQNHQFQEKDEIKIYPNRPGYGTEAFWISLALSIISTALSIALAPRPKKPSSSKSQPALGIGGIQNTIAPGTPKFITYGTRRVFGHLIASWIDMDDTDLVDRPDSSRRMRFSALYYMGVGQIAGMSEVKVNGTHLCDLEGPPQARITLGTSDQELMLNHELVHQVYTDGRELEIPLRRSKRLAALPGRPITYTTKGGNVNKVTLFFQFPGGLWQLGMNAGATYHNYVDIGILRKRNSDPEGLWTNLGTVRSIRTKTKSGFFWKTEIEFPDADQWDVKVNVAGQYGHGSWNTGPTMALFNVMETKYISTAYPGNALLEVHGIANDQISNFEGMQVSALVDGRLVGVLNNGIYTKQFSRNRVWIIRDILFDRDVGLGNRLSSTLWDDASSLVAANYYEETVNGYSGVQEQRDYCDIILNEAAPGWDHIKNLLFEGRAALIPSSGKFKYIVNIDRTPNLLYSFPGNIIENSLQFENGSQTKPVNTLRAEFPDESLDYKVIPVKLETADIGTDPERTESIGITSLVRESEVSRLMNFHLKNLTQIKKRWAWKSPQTAIVSEPLDIALLSYNVSKNLRGYNGFIKGVNHTTTRFISDRSIYLEPSTTYTAHVRHQNTVEERIVTNASGTHSLINLNSALTFTPENGDIWVVGKSSVHVQPIQIEEIEFDGESFIVKAHEHVTDNYTDTLSNISNLEGGTQSSSIPMPLLDAQSLFFNIGGVTQGYLFNIVPSFNYLVGTYSSLAGTTVVLENKELDVNDFFNGAYITADIDTPRSIVDYDGATRVATVSNAFVSALSVGGQYSIGWPNFTPLDGFAVEGQSGATWYSIDSTTGTSLSVLTGSTYSSFRFTPLSTAGTSNTTARIETVEGIFDTTPPATPLSVYVATDSARTGIATVDLLLPLTRDIQYLETEFVTDVSVGDTSLNTLFDVSGYRDERNNTGTVKIAASMELDSFPYGTTVYARSSTIDFFGNRSQWVKSFNTITLSSDPNEDGDDGGGDPIDDTGGTVGTTSGSARITLYSNTIDAESINTTNSLQLDLNLQVLPGSTATTSLTFYYTYGGTTASDLTAQISDNSTVIDDNSQYWLSFYLAPHNRDYASQDTISKKTGPEVPTNDVRSESSIIQVNSRVNQNMSIYLDIVGDTTTEVTVISAILKQIANANVTFTEPYIVAGTVPLKPSSNSIALVHPFSMEAQFPSNLVGSYGYTLTAAATTASFILKKNNTDWATMTFSPSVLNATFIGTLTSFSKGDVLTIVTPVISDPTLSDVGWSIYGTKEGIV